MFQKALWGDATPWIEHAHLDGIHVSWLKISVESFEVRIAKSKWRKCAEACGVIRDERWHAVDVCNMLGLSCGACQRTSLIFNMRQTAAKCVPPLPNSNQTQMCAPSAE
jgi:hypothetical protein